MRIQFAVLLLAALPLASLHPTAHSPRGGGPWLAGGFARFRCTGAGR
jgi:hypothetical protein